MNKTITDILEKHNHPKYYLSPMLLEVLNAAIIEICTLQKAQTASELSKDAISYNTALHNGINIATNKTTPNA